MASENENAKQETGSCHCVPGKLCQVEGHQEQYRLTCSDVRNPESTSNQSTKEGYRVFEDDPFYLVLRPVAKTTTSVVSKPIEVPTVTLTHGPLYVRMNTDSGERQGEVAAVEDELTIGQHTLHHVLIIVALETDTCFATAKDRGRLVKTCKEDCEIEVVGLVIDVVENVDVSGRRLRYATLAYHLSDVLAAFSREHFGGSRVSLVEDHFQETCRPVCDRRLVEVK